MTMEPPKYPHISIASPATSAVHPCVAAAELRRKIAKGASRGRRAAKMGRRVDLPGEIQAVMMKKYGVFQLVMGVPQ